MQSLYKWVFHLLGFEFRLFFRFRAMVETNVLNIDLHSMIFLSTNYVDIQTVVINMSQRVGQTLRFEENSSKKMWTKFCAQTEHQNIRINSSSCIEMLGVLFRVDWFWVLVSQCLKGMAASDWWQCFRIHCEVNLWVRNFRRNWRMLFGNIFKTQILIALQSGPKHSLHRIWAAVCVSPVRRASHFNSF